MTDDGEIVDLLIIGGGINGCGIARDAAGRGMSVALFEQGDLAGATSSASTKLVHGGLRYLENYEFGLVREALAERERIWSLAPHIVRPLRFVLPAAQGMRPWWMLRLGLFLYDHIGGRKRLPATRSLDLRSDEAGEPLVNGFARAFEYSDCWVDDARLVVLNALDAAERGAAIHTRTRVVNARREGALWRITTRRGDSIQEVRARAIVNAAGPWAAKVLDEIVDGAEPAKLRLVQGSHIVVPRMFSHDRCYLFQNGDGRIVFAIPYEADFTLIGTTDRDWPGEPGAAQASADEIEYLCKAANEYFRAKISPRDVVWSFAGLRPLLEDDAKSAQSATRGYRLELDAKPGEAPLLTIFGGKITTYRSMAERAMEKLGGFFPAAKPQGWTASAPLPGGDFPMESFNSMAEQFHAANAWLPAGLAMRLAHAYGTRAARVIHGAKCVSDLGEDFGGGLTEAEVRYLIANEWAVTAEDVLWRRTKTGLRVNAQQAARVEDFMQANLQP